MMERIKKMKKIKCRNVAIVLLLETCQMRWACMFIKQPQFIWECALSIAFVLVTDSLAEHCYFPTLFLTHCRIMISFFSKPLPQQNTRESRQEEKKHTHTTTKNHWFKCNSFAAQNGCALYTSQFIFIWMWAICTSCLHSMNANYL